MYKRQDLSLTSTGWAIDAADERRKWGVIKTARRGASRLAYIDDAITRLVEAEMPDLVVIENYAVSYTHLYMSHPI